MAVDVYKKVKLTRNELFLFGAYIRRCKVEAFLHPDHYSSSSEYLEVYLFLALTAIERSLEKLLFKAYQNSTSKAFTLVLSKYEAYSLSIVFKRIPAEPYLGTVENNILSGMQAPSIKAELTAFTKG